MPQKTNLNVAPYYDDFDSSDNFVRTLFRPGFAIQARELTQLQSALQNQIDSHARHTFKEGAMVIPGQVSFNRQHYSLKLASTYAGETINPAQYYNATTPVIITGGTTGVTAEVIGYDVATTTDQPTLYLRYLNTGTDGATIVFADGETIAANAGITHTTAYSSSVASASTYTSAYSVAAASTLTNLISSAGPASAVGSSVKVEAGVYYIRGHFVECDEQTLILDKYTNNPTYRVGFTVSETLVTPEDDSTLLDNATGSTNYAAKGAHRLKFTLTLSKLARDSTADSAFVQLLDTKFGVLQSMVRATEYGVLEETLARRTYDESGDYTVRPFQVQMREQVNLNERVGVYAVGSTTDDGNSADNTRLVAEVSMGKAYIRGYEVEKIAATYKDVSKARDFDTVNAGQTLANIGNFVLVDNLYGQPDISAISGENTAYKTIHIYSDFNDTRGSANTAHGNTNNIIGQCRARALEYIGPGPVGDNDTRYRLYLWDIKMFTYLTLNASPSPTLIANFSNGGLRIEGATSGAIGYVINEQATTTGTRVVLIKESGTFQLGEKLLASDENAGSKFVEGSDGADLTITTEAGNAADQTFAFSQARSFYMEDTGQTAGQDFTADIVLQPPVKRATELGSVVLDATASDGQNAGSKSGKGEDGDAGEDGTAMETAFAPRLVDAAKNNALEKLPKKVIKTLLTTNNSGVTDTQYTVRRQFIGTTNASGVVSFNASSNETFVALAEKDYTMSILTAGASPATGAQGQLVSIADTASGAGTVTLTITDNTILGNAAKVKLIATILKTSVTQKIKTTRLMKQLKVSTGATDAYGTRPKDRDISLGRADVFKMVGVFDSQDSVTDAAAPTLTTGAITGTFTRGETITGDSSGATGRIIGTSSPMSYVSTNAISFTNEKITGQSSGATATISSTTEGDLVITSRYVLDTGQRDNFYDISRITRKKGSAAPIGKLLVIYDYLEHGSGDIFTVDSYNDDALQMEYDDIPTYTGSKVDPDEPVPSGNFPLADSYDYRPTVDDVAGTSTVLQTVDEITGNSFNFASRTFGGTGGSTVDTPKPGSFIQADFEYYLPKTAAVALSSLGRFKVFIGASAENPMVPKIPDDSMLIATMFIPAYTFDPKDVLVKREKHQRFTMKDIGKLADRIEDIEYYTALTLLERKAESFEVTDANGLNRFKSGFMVDNFKGHRVGDTVHKDYKCSMDFELGELRPQHRTKSIPLIENATTTATRTAAGYQKTGNLLTLPYTEVTLTENTFATRLERVAPFLTATWIGNIDLSPDSDVWFETEIAPDLIINRNGDYDAVLAKERNNLGTVWNSWQTTWSGVTDSETEWGTWSGNLTGTQKQSRTIETVTTDQTRTGVNTQVTSRIEKESQGFKTISKVAIPVVRSKSISFVGENFKPKTRLYPFFNKTEVSDHVTPASSDYTSDTTIVSGSPLITTGTGKIEGTFLIPDPKVAGNPRFSTGDLKFRLTSSSIDGPVNLDSSHGTAGDAVYHASGMLETQQETIVATKVAEVVKTSVSQSTSSTSQSTGPIVTHGNPAPVAPPAPKVSNQTKSWPATGYVQTKTPDVYQGDGDAGDAGGDGGDGGTWICTATYGLGLIDRNTFHATERYGVLMRRNDPYLMKGYDLIGKKLASYVGKNKMLSSFGEFFSEFNKASYYSRINNKPLTIKHKIYKHFISETISKPILRLIGWVSEKLEK